MEKIKKIGLFIRKNIKWFILFYCILSLIFIIKDVFLKDFIQYDKDIYKFMSRFINNDNTRVVKFITNLGSSYVLIMITLLMILFIRNRCYGVLVGINLGVVVILNNLLKIIIRRSRPIDISLISETGYSFPSGHAMVSMAFYGFMIYLIYKKLKNKWLKWSLIILNIILIVLIGMSRIYLGVHYPSDVIAGFLVGIAYLILYTNIVKKYLVSD